MISCVIPAAKICVENINIRKFKNTTLLELKINNIVKLPLDEIIISSNDTKVKRYLNNDMKFDLRHENLCLKNIDHNVIYKYYSNIAKHDTILHTTITCPFISENTFMTIIDLWNNNNYDVICIYKSSKNYLDMGSKINLYNYNKILPECCIIFNKVKYLEYSDFFCDSMNFKLIEINEVETFSIKSNTDFLIAESIYYRHFNQQKNIDSFINNFNFQKTKILDCTIRDSGYLNNWNWTIKEVKDIAFFLGEIGIDYVEIGFFRNKNYNDTKTIWTNLQDNLDLVKDISENTKAKITIMIDISNYLEEYFDVNELPNCENTGIGLIRVFSFMKVIDKSFKVCNILKEKGYTVSLNIGHCIHLEEKDKEFIKNSIINKIVRVDYLYFADSLGMLTPNDINNFMIYFKQIYPVKNGFHNHNNNGTVLGNVIQLINYNIDIIDATVSGFGKNGGNCNLEQLVMYLFFKEQYTHLNIEKLLYFLDKIPNLHFGNLDLDTDSIKLMLHQFMNVHSSYFIPIKDQSLVSIYNKLKSLKTIKKLNWN